MFVSDGITDLEHLPLRGEYVLVRRRCIEEVVARICCHVARNIFCQGEREGGGYGDGRKVKEGSSRVEGEGRKEDAGHQVNGGWKGECKVPADTPAMAPGCGSSGDRDLSLPARGEVRVDVDARIGDGSDLSFPARGLVRGDARVGDGADLSLPASCSAASV